MIQETSDPGGASPMVGTTVITQGVVSGLVPGNNPGFFIQDGSGPWSGLYVFFAPTGLEVGHQVSVTGTVTEFNGQTQLASVTNVQTIATGQPLTPTVITTANANTEPYESVLVRVNAATCTAQGGFGQFTVNDGSGPVLVDDVIYAHPFTVGGVYNITGPLQYAFSEWRILPRSAADVELVTGMAETAFGQVMLHPNPVSDLLTLTFQPTGARTELTLADAAGRVTLTEVLTGDRPTIALDGVANGTYVLTLRNGAAAWSTRVVVAR
jgi:hypothetical protein